MSRVRKSILTALRGGGAGGGDGSNGPTSLQARHRMAAALRQLADDGRDGKVDLSRYLATPEHTALRRALIIRRGTTNDA